MDHHTEIKYKKIFFFKYDYISAMIHYRSSWMIFSLEELGVDLSEVGGMLGCSEGGVILEESDVVSTAGLEGSSGFFGGGFCFPSAWWYKRDFCRSISSFLI
jgi:hypothetical protein